MISVRIVSIEYYMCFPIRDLDVMYSEFRSGEIKQVPVIQIYGASESGHKTCVNLHGVFPYIYIPYDGTEPASNLSYKIATELDKAINVSLGRSSSNAVHVHNIVLVSGIPFYGYHGREHQFFKIYFYNPAIIKKACSLLQNEAVQGKSYQPYESHINYILQFLIDYNLHGMSLIHFSRVLYRINPEDLDLLADVPPDLILPNYIPRRSVCKYEVDAQASSITNRDEISTGKLAVNPGIAALWEDEKQRRRNKEMDSQISFSLTQERDQIYPTKTHLMFENILEEKLSRKLTSEDSSLELDNSVYPAETPEDADFLNASAVEHTILETTLMDETLRDSQEIMLNENDAKLLELLQDLKEIASVEEDSVLSQQVDKEELDDDDQNLTLPFKNLTDDDSIWENSFWDENCKLSQIDGLYDTDNTSDSVLSDFNLNFPFVEPIIYQNKLDEIKLEDTKYRIASEVYIDSPNMSIPEDQKLYPGIVNKLILQKRNSPTRSVYPKITILSNVCLTPAYDCIKKEGNNQDLLLMYDVDNLTPNDVIINDVSLGTRTPNSSEEWDKTSSDILRNCSPGFLNVSPNYTKYFNGEFFDGFNTSLIESPEREKSPLENIFKSVKVIRNATKGKHGNKTISKINNNHKKYSEKEKSPIKIIAKSVEVKQNITKGKEDKKTIWDVTPDKNENELTERLYHYNLRPKELNHKCKSCPGCRLSEIHPKPTKSVKNDIVKINLNSLAYFFLSQQDIEQTDQNTEYNIKKTTNISNTSNCLYTDQNIQLFSSASTESTETKDSKVNPREKNTEEKLTTSNISKEDNCVNDVHQTLQLKEETEINNPNENSQQSEKNSDEKHIIKLSLSSDERKDENSNTTTLQINCPSEELIEKLKRSILNWGLDGQGDSPSSDSAEEKESVKNASPKIVPKKYKKTKISKKMLCRTPGLSKIAPRIKKRENIRHLKNKRNLMKPKTNGISPQLQQPKRAEENNSAETEKKELRVVLVPLQLDYLKSRIIPELKTTELEKLNNNEEKRKNHNDTVESKKQVTCSKAQNLKHKLISNNNLPKCSSADYVEHPDKKLKINEILNSVHSTIEQSLSSTSDEIIQKQKKKRRVQIKRKNKSLSLKKNAETIENIKTGLTFSSSSDESPKQENYKLKTRSNKKSALSTNKVDTPTELIKTVALTKNLPNTNYFENTSESEKPAVNKQTILQKSGRTNQENLIKNADIFKTINEKIEIPKMEVETTQCLRVTRSMSSLSSDSLNNMEEKLNNNRKNTKFDLKTCMENMKSPISISVSSDSSENTIERRSTAKKKEIKSSEKTEGQIKLCKHVTVKLERLYCTTGINKEDTLYISSGSSEAEKQQVNETENSEKPPVKILKINGVENQKKGIKKINSNVNKSPIRRTRETNNISSSKYSPLNIIRSPKKNFSVILKDTNIEVEPITKKMRIDFQGTHPIAKEKENQTHFPGTGELKNIPMLQAEVQNCPANVTNANHVVLKNCDIIDKKQRTISILNSIKKQLFDLKRNELNVTVSDEFKSCSYTKSIPKIVDKSTDSEIDDDIMYLRNLRKNEEIFLNEIESNCLNNNQNDTENISVTQLTNTSSNNITDQSSNTVNSNKIKNILETTNIEDYINEPNTQSKTAKLNESIIIRKNVKKKDKKPVSPTKNFDFVEESPEKNKSFSPRETLSQQGENELRNIEKYNTKIHNLTVAEKYDLKRDFAPLPGTSKVPDEILLYDESANDSFIYNDISLIDNSFVSNKNPISQLSSQIMSFLEKCTVNDINLKTSKIWMPKYFPPSKEDVKNSLSEYNIPEHRYLEPFYSDYTDVTGNVDIGHNILKIRNTAAADLEEFESCTGFIGIEKWRREKFKQLCPTDEICKNIKVALATHKKIVMRPIQNPPTRKEISTWIKQKNNEIVDKKTTKTEKIRIIIPNSPGNSNDSFNDSVISMSPCTPISPSSSQNIIESSQTTPLSSQNSPTMLRKGKLCKRGNLQRKALFSQSKKSQEEEKLRLLNISESRRSTDSCQITGITLDNTHGFQMSYENLQDAKAVSEHQYLTILVMELHIRTRGDFNPDPQYDSIRAIFYSILNDVPEDFSLPREETGVIIVDTLPGSPVKQKQPILDGTGVKCKIKYVKSEIELIDEFIKLIRKWDPDIFVGFEIEMLSWGYLIDRCYVIGIHLPSQISRVSPDIIKNKADQKQSEQELKLTGRIILDGWRLFRHEIALQSYTFENLMYHILHQRIPTHSFKNLSFWWEYRTNYFRHITANYYITRVEGILKLLDQLDIIGRTSELARLFGIQFYEVLSRGSQFRVESMMLGLAKPLNYIPISPSVQQRANMKAPEYIPLIIEPESRFYTDPLIVLDFQSLYPSIIIAYNYCFSTCVGRVEKLGTNLPFPFGACQLKISRSTVQKLQHKINFSPCGVGFVKPEVRQGILPKMLKEILETRLMVKSSMKENKANKILQRVLHNRQLGLKLIANVTYGYTSANFSGRMPCMEVGDSVVSKGRETLERAIRKIEQTDRWRARVVYGDTDSLFVLVPGRSREEAFKIGAEIADEVTQDNPPPIKLKLEKVYHPSILQTKKRYVGYMYESPEQKKPEYDAKGIETVRRDGCPAVAKMLEKSLRLLFETQDVSLVKRYVCRQFEKILTGKASIQDLIFAREYRGASGYRPGACVPALELARRWTANDKRLEPRRGERVPYVIVHGPPGVPLIRLVRSPRELLNPEQNVSLRPNAEYYITRVIAPPLNRCLSLIGANVLLWFNEMPRKQLQILPTDIHFEKSKKSTISQYFATMSCVVCNNQTRDGLCEYCLNNPQRTVVDLQMKLRQREQSYDDVKQICQSCCSRGEYTDCESLDCPVLYRLSKIKRDLKQVPFLRTLLLNFENEDERK